MNGLEPVSVLSSSNALAFIHSSQNLDNFGQNFDNQLGLKVYRLLFILGHVWILSWFWSSNIFWSNNKIEIWPKIRLKLDQNKPKVDLKNWPKQDSSRLKLYQKQDSNRFQSNQNMILNTKAPNWLNWDKTRQNKTKIPLR